MIKFLIGVIVGILIFFFFVYFGGGKTLKKVGYGLTDTGKKIEVMEEMIKKKKGEVEKDVEKDVKLVQQPRTDWANTLAQLERGEVQFSLLPPPYDRIGEKRGFHTLLSLPDMGIAWQQNGEWVLKSYLQSNRATVLRFLRVIGDAMKVYFEEKDKTISYLSEFLGSNRADTEYAYEAYLKWVDHNPRPTLESIRTTLDSIKKATPKAATADPASFIDTSLVDQLVKEGYFK